MAFAVFLQGKAVNTAAQDRLLPSHILLRIIALQTEIVKIGHDLGSVMQFVSDRLQELAEAAGAIFEAFDDIPAAMILRRTVAGVYDPKTGKTGPATITDYACQGVTSTYTQREIDGTNIRTTDRRVAIRQQEVAGAGVVTTADKLVMGSAVRTIVNVQADAASALWLLQVR